MPNRIGADGGDSSAVAKSIPRNKLLVTIRYILAATPARFLKSKNRIPRDEVFPRSFSHEILFVPTEFEARAVQMPLTFFDAQKDPRFSPVLVSLGNPPHLIM